MSECPVCGHPTHAEVFWPEEGWPEKCPGCQRCAAERKRETEDTE